MCYHVEQKKIESEIENWHQAKFDVDFDYTPSYYNGFSFPATPVITNADIHAIKMYHWGLIPFWAKDTTIRKNTLNAKIETIAEKPAFKNSISNRCIILIDRFFEWKWLDEKGKVKEKYEITFPEQVPFSLAGLYNSWTDRSSGENLETYTILTTEANELMSDIHNTKKRMPVMLTREKELRWLQGENYLEFALFEDDLVATKM